MIFIYYITNIDVQWLLLQKLGSMHRVPIPADIGINTFRKSKNLILLPTEYTKLFSLDWQPV